MRITPERRAAGSVDASAPGGRIAGYAAIFNARADIGGYFEEEIAQGAFAAAIARDDVRALIDHDSARVLGRTKAGTLRLSEDERGLRFDVDLPATTIAADLKASMARGDIDQASFGFSVAREEWIERGADAPLRRILEIGTLFDVSVVTFPAYEQTEAALRSLESFRAGVKPAGKTAGYFRRRMRLGLAERGL